MGQPSWVGQTLGGRYQILEVVGQGGMSAVYKAKDPNLQRIVAVKLIHPHLSTDPKFIVRFEEEARAVAQLRHPNIVQVYDFNHDQDVYYMVQEFVPGETLQARLRRLNSVGRRMSVEESIRYARDILNAMGYAHQRGMIHRDIKPANIMLDVQGQGILMDFGIVKILGGETHTATGAVVGTAMYMSPELIRGEPPDERSDIYSLGVTLFEMVSGRPPFEAESAMTLMMMHLNDPVPNLPSLRPEIPEDMVAVIQKSLSKDRANRYGSAAELSAALKRILDRLEGGLPYSATEIDESPLAPEPKAAAAAAAASVAGSLAETPKSGVDQPASAATPGTAADMGAVAAASIAASGTQAERSAAGVAGTMAETPASGYASTMAETPPGGAVVPPGTTSGGMAAGSGAGGSPPSTPPAGSATSSGSKRNPMALYAVLGVVTILVLVVGGIWIGSTLGGDGGEGTQVAGALPGEATQTLESTPQPSATQEATATITPTPTETQPPTATATLTALPLREPPPGTKFARINGITVNANNQYEVVYETFEYTEAWGSEHVHFFFNTVPEQEAGMPGSGPWELYGGPRPFTVYTPAQRPANAAAMCALFAYPDHSIEPGSGTCYPLPDQVVLTALENTVCRSSPSAEASVTTDLPQWVMLLVKGRTSNSRWWNVQNPLDLNGTCWASIDSTLVTGNLGAVPVTDPTPEPGAAGAYTVQITGISLDAQYNYVVEYQTTGFTEAENSLHIHFFFDTVPPDQAGVPGDFSNWFVYYGPRPFTGYNLADKPEAAVQMCALVANPDHTVMQGTGNCFNLP